MNPLVFCFLGANLFICVGQAEAVLHTGLIQARLHDVPWGAKTSSLKKNGTENRKELEGLSLSSIEFDEANNC
jgi:hypothetical protein